MSFRRATLVIFVVIGLAALASVAGLLVMSASLGTPTRVLANSTLYLRISAPMSEVEPFGVLSAFVHPAPTLRETVDLIRKAKRDSRIAGLVVIPQTDGALWGQVQEVYEAIEDFKTSGKPATAYLESGGTGEYYIASACDRILMMPSGELDLSGLTMYELFFRGALDKLGIYPDLLHIGDYKTAANTFTEKGFTAAHRQMDESLTADAFDQLVHAIAQGRKRSEADVRAIIDGGPYLADGAKQAGLVDALAYEDQIDDAPPVAHTWEIDGSDYESVPMSSVGLGQGPQIALLYAVGTIASGTSSFDGTSGLVLGSQTFIEWLRTVRVDDNIKAIVIRIDSPGGSAIASDVIWRELMLTRAMKPVVVSMGDVAASGGYYIALPAQAIVAQPGTLTGSIGVVTGKFAVGGALDKLGVGTGTVAQGKFADIDSPFQPYTPAERARVEEQLHATYNLFVSKVAEARHSTPDKIDAVAQGRVWTGRQALQLGLVDALGGLQDAITLAKQRAKLDPTQDVTLVVYPGQRSLYDLFANGFSPSVFSSASLLSRPEARALTALSTRLQLFHRNEPLAILPNIYWGQ